MKVIIMRGIPGSGKSTFARNYELRSSTKTVIVSADDYFKQQDGSYNFVPEKIGEAHAQCADSFWFFLRQDKELRNGTLIVDNTNTSVWEIAPYYQTAITYKQDPEILLVHCDPQLVFDNRNRNTHNVPRGKIWQMYQNILTEKLPPHWKQNVILSSDIRPE